MHSRRNGVNPILLASPTQKPPFVHEGGLCRSRCACESRGDPKGRVADGVRRVAGMFLMQVWRVSGARQGTGSRRRFPAPSTAARGVSPLATPSSRAASPPSDAQSAVRHAGGLPALALTTARRLASGCCGPPLRRSRWKAMLSAPSRHVQDPPPRDSVAPSSGYARQGPPGTSRKLSAARKLSRKSRSLPLDPRWRGGARMASRAKARRARRKSGAYARAAFAR